MAYGDRFQKKQERAAWAVVEFGTIRAAALAIGVPERTLRRWSTKPAFQAATQKAQNAALTEVTRKLAGAGTEAVDTLLEVMRNKSNPPGVRVRASLGILGMMIAAGEFVDLDSRILAIEEAQWGNVANGEEQGYSEALEPD